MGLFSFLKKDSISSKIENISLNRLIPKCKERKIDTVFITTSRNCSYCSKYNRKIYSIYGWNKKYPKLPEFLYTTKCPHCGKSMGASLFQPGINTQSK